jgi:hypothetical protein
MKNKLIDLHNILFEQLERLNDLDEEEMKSEKLINEIRRSDALNRTAAQINNAGRLAYDVMKFSDTAPEGAEMPEMLVTKALPPSKHGAGQ